MTTFELNLHTALFGVPIGILSILQLLTDRSEVTIAANYISALFQLSNPFLYAITQTELRIGFETIFNHFVNKLSKIFTKNKIVPPQKNQTTS